MTKLEEVCDRKAFFDLIDAGFINARQHPTLDLTIYKYSKTAPYNFKPTKWPEPLMLARGLVLNSNEEIIARGFRKFFNYSEQKPPFAKENKPVIFEKVDGSCLLVFRYAGQYVFATLGSFQSDQALWAAQFWKRNAKYHFSHQETFTFIYEVVYPQNRNVVNYGRDERLVWIGYIDPNTGKDYDIRRFDSYSDQIGHSVKIYEFDDIKSCLASADECKAAESEGYVLTWYKKDDTAFRLKVKGSDYMQMHRLLYGTSNRSVWELLLNGKTPDEIRQLLPEQTHEWLDKVLEDLVSQYERIEYLALLEFEVALYLLGEEGIDPDSLEGRKEFARLVVRRTPRWGIIFQILDKQDYTETIWKMVRPVYAKAFLSEIEE